MRGITQVFEGRRVFENLTVEENLVVGGHVQASMQRVRQAIDLVFEYFPLLKERRRQHAGYLSGGEQQMLAIGRALVSEPKVILLDEPSLGLAPLIVESIFGIIRRLKEERGQTVLLVEQNAALALDLADHGYVMENGRIVLEGPAAGLRENSGDQGILSGSERGRRPPILPRCPPAPTAAARAGLNEKGPASGRPPSASVATVWSAVALVGREQPGPGAVVRDEGSGRRGARWFRATALGTCWLGAWATTPGNWVKKVLATVPSSPSPAKAEPTPSASTAAAASIMVFIVILLWFASAVSREPWSISRSLRG